MSRIIYILILFSLSLNGYAQEIIIQPPLITPFECTEFYKLYTGTVSNFSNATFRTKVIIEVDYTSPAGNSQRLADGILSGNPSVDFPPGVTIVNNATYERLYSSRNITFYDKEIENLLSKTKCIPPGQYDVCLTLMNASAPAGSKDFLSQTCYTREKQMLSNLFLVSPFEGGEVNIDLPLFTWTPVTPIYSGAMYRIQIVEMLANQTAYEAFRSNPIFFEQSGMMSNIFQYPVSARTMLPCTRYAWRVTYELGGGFVGTAFKKVPDFLQESEIWEFSKECGEEEEDRTDILVCNDYQCIFELPNFFNQLVDKDQSGNSSFDPQHKRKVEIPACFGTSPFIHYYWMKPKMDSRTLKLNATIGSVSADHEALSITMQFSRAENTSYNSIGLDNYVNTIDHFSEFKMDTTQLNPDGEAQYYTAVAYSSYSQRIDSCDLCYVPIKVNGYISSVRLGRCCVIDPFLDDNLEIDIPDNINPNTLKEELWYKERNLYYDPLWSIMPCRDSIK